MTTITLKKENKTLTIEESTTAAQLALQLKLTAPNEALAAEINGELKDLNTPLFEGDVVNFLSFEEPQGKDLFWHSSAHILAQAVLRLWPNAKPTIGPPIESGFYYDFANLSITDEDLPRIEEEMKKIIAEDFKTERQNIPSKTEALQLFAANPYKVELIENFSATDTITAYRQGEFFDLCRGPHLPRLGKVKAVKVLKVAGAYWRGDSNKEMLTRIYAISFPDREQLKEYLAHLEEAKKRDHKILGPKLDLFSLRPEAPGMPFIHPKGMLIWNELLRYFRECHDEAGYQEIKTPIMMAKELWQRSGHWENYRENMYVSSVDERDFAIKPMNCPGAFLTYSSTHRSYRELPLRLAEIGQVHRHEAHGALSGLVRLRTFHQDDAHIFLTMDQLQAEISSILELVKKMYTCFGLTFELALSTRPEKDTIGSDEDWIASTDALKAALNASGRPYTINAGDGAFYGPKIDIHIRDALSRRWQCCTIQLDMAQPLRFNLEYDASDGTRQKPVILHRVIYGSIERFLGILIEHFAGKFPLWLSPRQVRLIAVADRHVEYAKLLEQQLKARHFHVQIDDSNESVSKKVREAQLMQVNYMLTVGDREVETQKVNVRTRDNVVHGEMAFDTFVELIENERKERSLTSRIKK